MQQLVIYWQSTVPQHVSGIFMPIIRRSDCVTLPIIFCPVLAVVMLESEVARYVHCVEEVATAYRFLSCCRCCDAGERGGKMCAL
jgi:hypothetical protein